VPPNVTIDGDCYFDGIILNFVGQVDAVHPEHDWLLQQDSARPHVGEDVISSMKYLGSDLLPNWAPSSPDLDIIERVWAVINAMIATRDPKNLEELREVLQQVWPDLKIAPINYIVPEMP
jgi:hypothetical protein